MASKSPLDVKILTKIANKRGKDDITPIRKIISARASKGHISPQAALVLVAHQHGIKTTVYERGLDPAIREEIRTASGTTSIQSHTTTIVRHSKASADNKKQKIWWENPWLVAIFSGLFLFLLGTYIAHVLGWFR